jgi:amidase
MGIVGIKPTVGLVGRSGIIPIAHNQDTAGPMVRTVQDGAILLGALTGIDPRDGMTGASDGNSQADYTQSLDAAGLEGARLGVARNFPFRDDVVSLFDEATAAVKDAGATIIDPADVPNLDKYGDSEFEVLLYEFKADLNSYLESLGPGARVKSLAEIIEFNEQNREREMPFFGQDILIAAQEKGPLTDPAYLDALANGHRYSRREGIDQVMDEHNLDAIIAPTGGPAWMTDHVNGDTGTGFSSRPAAVSGYPSITVPMGFVSGLPIGISFFGRAWTEPVLLKFAYAFEQSTKHRQAPKFLQTVG